MKGPHTQQAARIGGIPLINTWKSEVTKMSSNTARKKLYIAYSNTILLPELKPVCIAWFYEGRRSTPLVEYEFVIEEYWHLSNEERACSEMAVDELLSWKETQILDRFCRGVLGIYLHTRQVTGLPMSSDTIPACEFRQEPGVGQIKIPDGVKHVLPFRLGNYYIFESAEEFIERYASWCFD